MTLTKVHLVEAIAEQNGFTKKQSTETVETILELIKSTLAAGEDVLISGFGKFCVKEKRERKGRNPATGDAGTEEGCDFQVLGEVEGEGEWGSVEGIMNILM